MSQAERSALLQAFLALHIKRELTDQEVRFVEWLAGWEPHMAETLRGLIKSSYSTGAFDAQHDTGGDEPCQC